MDFTSFIGDGTDEDSSPYTKANLKMCEEKDFCIHYGGKGEECSDEQKYFYYMWNDFSILCPDLQSIDDGGIIHGSMADLKSS